MIDFQTVLHHICHISHAHRGQVQVLENLRQRGEVGFLCCIDLPDSQFTTLNPIAATQPLLASIRQQMNNTNPDVMIEALDAQMVPMPGETRMHKLYLRIAAKQREDEGFFIYRGTMRLEPEETSAGNNCRKQTLVAQQ
jgi:hypothetical protein